MHNTGVMTISNMLISLNTDSEIPTKMSIEGILYSFPK